MHSKRYAIAGMALSGTLFVAAVWFLVHTIRKYDLGVMLGHLQSVPPFYLWISVGFCVLSYCTLILYDVLAFHWIGKKISIHRIAYASFIAHALGNNIGFSFLSGGSLRFRLFHGMGMTAMDTIRVVAFYTITFFVGITAIGGFLLTFVTPHLPDGTAMTPAALKLIGLFMLLTSFIYLLFSVKAPRIVRFLKWEFTLPPLRIALAQIGITAIDWVMTGAILYFLLPVSPLNFIDFLGIFLAAHIAGMASNIPGGLGVFDTVLILLLGPFYDEPQILSAIVLYRLIFYIFPLIIGVIFFCLHEAKKKRKHWLDLLKKNN